LAGALVTAPADGAELYFNSYGWDKVYRMGTGGGPVSLLPADDILKTTFTKTADFASDGLLYGVGSGDLYRVQINHAGTATWSKGATIAGGADYISFAPQDQLYATLGSTLRRVNAGDGATVAGTTVSVTYQGSAVSFRGIDFAPDGTLYGADSGALYQIDPASGLATKVLNRPNLDGGVFSEVDVADDGVVRLLGSFNYLFEYNPATQASGWAPGPLTYNGSSFSPSSLASGPAVPEPVGAGVVVAGAVLAAGARRRRRVV